MKILLVAIGLLAGLILYFYNLEPPSSLQPESNQSEKKDPLVRVTSSGILHGIDGKTHYAWLGIPYGQSTAGSYRWQAPRPYISNTMLMANHFGNACSQPGMVVENHRLTEMRYEGSENCLFLNIWSPKHNDTDATPIPVVVWIHGGANVIGNGNINGGKLASSQRLIVVSMNYRLGILGWLSHPALRNTAESPAAASGNFGTLDIIESLEWVQHNISQFGGDPDNIIIMGLSAGGWNVFSLLHSPIAEGLFHKAIIHSGEPRSNNLTTAEHLIDDAEPGHPQSSGELVLQLLINNALAFDRQSAKNLAENMSSDEMIQYLRAQSHPQLEKALHQLAQQYNQYLSSESHQGGTHLKRLFRRHNHHVPRLNYQAPMLFSDGLVISKQGFYSAIDKGDINRVPIIVGSTKDESKNFQILDPVFVSIQNKKREIKNHKRYNLANHYISQLWKSSGVDQPARAMADLVDIFAFRFDWDDLSENSEGENLKALYGASHGIDQAFIFGDTTTPFSKTPLAYQDQQLSMAVMNYWAEFAYNGKPGKGRSGQLPEWKPWSNMLGSKDKTLLLNKKSSGGIRMSAIQTDRENIIKEVLASKNSSNDLVCDTANSPINYLTPAELNRADNILCDAKPIQ